MFRKKLEGFSLIEISIVLLIIGIVAGAALKGRDLLESAKIKAVASDVQVLLVAFENYTNLYGSPPGDDKKATSKFSNVSNGDGDGKFSENDAKNVFTHLFHAGIIDSEGFKNPKIGGAYEMVAEKNCLKLKLSKSGEGFLSKKQVVSISAQCNELIGNSDSFVEIEPSISDDNNQKYLLKFRIN